LATVKHFDPRVNTTYVYDSKKVYDKATHKKKLIRKLIGKIDPNTGAIVPTGPVGRPAKKQAASVAAEGNPSENTIDYKAQYEAYRKDREVQNERIARIESELYELRNAYKKCMKDLHQIAFISARYLVQDKEGD